MGLPPAHNFGSPTPDASERNASEAPPTTPRAKRAAWAAGLSAGVGLAVFLAAVALFLADWFGTSVLGYYKSPISTIAVAIVLGLVLGNLVSIPHVLEPGLRLCGGTVLRLGIVLLGLRLSVGEAGRLAGLGLPVILVCVTAALVIGTWVNRRLGLSRQLGCLIAVGTSICGVSAIAAAAPIIEAEEDEVSCAVACVALFGLAALLLYPLLAYAAFPDNPQAAGIFLGTAIHDTSQVTGAGLATENLYARVGHGGAGDALDAATVSKLVRNTCMAGVIPLMALLYRQGAQPGKHRSQSNWRRFLPWFVFGFVLLASLRSLGDNCATPFGIMSQTQWQAGLAAANQASAWLLTVAMAAIGLSTRAHRLVGLGFRPFLAGLTTALIVGGVGFSLLYAFAG